jgi:hypothetical protein
MCNEALGKVTLWPLTEHKFCGMGHDSCGRKMNDVDDALRFSR